MKKSLLLFLSFILTSELLACSCFGPTTFCETLSGFEANDQEPLIVNAIVSEKKDNGMDITIQSVLRGEITEEKVFIKSDNGAECIYYTNSFSKNENYIFILSEYYDDYALSRCHVSFLKIEDGIVTGPIAPDVESLPYDEINSLGDCGSTKLNLFSINSLTLFPNPTFNEIYIKNSSNSDAVTILQLEIIDTLGRHIRLYKKEDGIYAGEEWIINASELAVGVYFLKITGSGEKEIFKIVKY